MSTGDVIDRAVRLYRRNFTPLVGITAVPTLIGYFVSLMLGRGYTSLLSGLPSSRGLPVTAIWMLALGAFGYPVWLYSLLMTVSGLSRVVADHVMLGEPITFRRCFAAVKRRLAAISLMGLLSIAMLLAASFIAFIILFVLMLFVTIIVGVIAAVRLPQWVMTTGLIVTVIVVVAVSLLLFLAAVARVVFLPQIVMIEGQSAGNALSRAIRLGKGNWYRVGAIGLFTYFVSMSLLAALALPVLIALYFSGMLNAEFFAGSTWSILYTSFGQISNLLSLPILIVAFTLLYFDSRVRQEAYDVDLIAREINPGFYWQPTMPSPAPGYQFAQGRAFVQTSPLGLAGYPPSWQPTEASPEDAWHTAADESPDSASQPDERVTSNDEWSGRRDSDDATSTKCNACGAPLLAGASFCMNCGSLPQ
jgi:hypothetical protein